jgi:hypothetical protein
MGKMLDDMAGNRLSVGTEVVCRGRRGVHTFEISRIHDGKVYDGPSPYLPYKCVRKDKFNNLNLDDADFFHESYGNFGNNHDGRNNNDGGARGGRRKTRRRKNKRGTRRR